MDSAERWSSTELGFTPTVGDLRGSIVQAYYAVFHRLAEVCAERIVGERSKYVHDSRAWNQFYRSLRHDIVRAARVLKSTSEFSANVRSFFRGFAHLQDARELCSYEALVEPSIEHTHHITATAEGCIDSLDRIEESEMNDFLALVMLSNQGPVKKVRTREDDHDISLFEKIGQELKTSCLERDTA